MNNRSVGRQHNHNVARKTGMKLKRPCNNRGNRVYEMYGLTLIEHLRLNVRLGCTFFPLWKLVCHFSQLSPSFELCAGCNEKQSRLVTCSTLERKTLFTALLWFLRYTQWGLFNSRRNGNVRSVWIFITIRFRLFFHNNSVMGLYLHSRTLT